jgi:hypothetical protein
MKISDINLSIYKDKDLISLTCSVCNINFSRKKRDIKTSIRRATYIKNGDIRCNKCALTLYTESINCKHCHKELNNKRNKFCSHSCAAKHNNAKKENKTYESFFDEKTGKTISRVIKNNICENCGKKYRKSCSAECKRDVYIKRWLRGDETGNYRHGISSVIREYLLKKNDYKCQSCGFSGVNQKTQKSILQIDHIDGRWENSSPNNLRVLCPNCHALTETYGSLNMGKGRKWKSNYAQF